MEQRRYCSKSAVQKCASKGGKMAVRKKRKTKSKAKAKKRTTVRRRAAGKRKVAKKRKTHRRRRKSGSSCGSCHTENMVQE
jgi:hypothetical protein